jgi:hypothetical protein
MDVLDWLAHWYEAQCDGDWEHGFGPSIGTIDNPGWLIKIDLSGTDCDGRVLERVWHDREHETEWWTCWTEDNTFQGAGGPLTLRSLLEAFRDWTEKAR